MRRAPRRGNTPGMRMPNTREEASPRERINPRPNNSMGAHAHRKSLVQVSSRLLVRVESVKSRFLVGGGKWHIAPFTRLSLVPRAIQQPLLQSLGPCARFQSGISEPDHLARRAVVFSSQFSNAPQLFAEWADTVVEQLHAQSIDGGSLFHYVTRGIKQAESSARRSRSRPLNI